MANTGEKVIVAENLTKQFGDFVATDHITFDVRKGEIFGFLGANGAGKTTAMRMLCGLSQPTDGRATVAGFDVAKQHELVKRNIGYMSQKFSLYDDLTVEENLKLFGGIYGMANVKSEAGSIACELVFFGNDADRSSILIDIHTLDALALGQHVETGIEHDYVIPVHIKG